MRSIANYFIIKDVVEGKRAEYIPMLLILLPELDNPLLIVQIKSEVILCVLRKVNASCLNVDVGADVKIVKKI